MRLTITIWSLLLLNITGLAQQIPYAFRTLDINQGLSQNSVIDMATDGKGFLWLATQDGLNRYDGRGISIFRKNFDDITTRAYSRLGKVIPGKGHYLWLITSGGKLEQFNLLNDSSMAIRSLGTGHPLPAVSCLWEEADALWIGTEKNGLYYQHKRSGRIAHLTRKGGALTSDSVQFLYRCTKEKLWVLTSNGIHVLGASPAAMEKHLCPTAAPGISCSVLEEDRQGTLWLGTFARGLYRKGATDSTFVPFTGFAPGHSLPADLVVQAIRTDQQGRVWIGTLGKGLYIIDEQASTITHLLPEEGNAASLSYIDVLCIKPDKLGGMWVGTDGGGANFYDQRLNLFSLLSKNTLPKNIPIEQVRAITTDPYAGIWIGTSSGGLAWAPLHDARAIQKVPLTGVNGINDKEGRIMSLRTDGIDTWIGTQDNGLLIMNNLSKKIKATYSPQGKGVHYLPDHTVWCMLPQQATSAWLGTRNAGLCLVDKQKGLIRNYQYLPGQEQGIADNNIRALIRLNDSILCLGFERKGIQFFNTRSEKFSFLSYDQPLQQLRQDEPTLKCLYFRPPCLWIGTLGQGIIILDTTSGKLVPLDEKSGLPNNTIYSILPDQQGNLWMSTNGGITRFTPPANLHRINRSHFSLFTAEDGLQGNEFNTGAYYADANGLLYFGGTNGLNWINPARYTGIHNTAPVVITEAAINNEPWKGDTAITYKSNWQLPWHRNSLSFTFAALDFVAPRKFNYYYQLYPYDKNWIFAGNRNYVAYTNIPPGQYTFRVKAWDQSAAGNNKEALLAITITPPFWKTPWFIALLVLVLAALLYALYRYRINQLIALQKVRNRIATDLHDDIGSTLTNISILSELSKQKLAQHEDAGVFLNRIAEEVHNSSQALDDIVWSINTNNDTLEQTVARMRRYAAEVFDGANIHYTLQLDDHFAHRKLNMEQRRDCFLLFKEAINNIYKHAAAKNVAIRVWIEGNQLHMTIRDDGKGFDPAQATHRNGLKNMQQRLAKWAGVIDIQSTMGKGTRMAIRLPVAG